ncbi:hypothetical protein [Vibrio sp.]|uniref:hypothetical protein n=1 Tax=Vibrio sp. TaxID=678 RepID=UPI003D0B9CB5
MSYYGDIVRKDIADGRKYFKAEFVMEIIERLEKEMKAHEKTRELAEEYMEEYCKANNEYIVGFND